MGPLASKLPQTQSSVEIQDMETQSSMQSKHLTCENTIMDHPTDLQHEAIIASLDQKLDGDVLEGTMNDLQDFPDDYQGSPAAGTQMEALYPANDEKIRAITIETVSTSIAPAVEKGTFPAANDEPPPATADDDRERTVAAVQAPSAPLHSRKQACQAPTFQPRNRSSENRNYKSSSNSRPQYRSYTNGPRQNDDSERVIRLNAQLMKLQNDLNAERKNNIQMRASIEAEQQRASEETVSSLLASVFTKQTEALRLKEAAAAHERSLLHRSKWIQQLEIYLAEGQKRLKYQLEERGIGPMAAIDRAQIEREAELNAQRKLEEMQAGLAAQTEQLRHREAVQDMREGQYMEIVREKLLAELRADFITREKVKEIADSAYHDGYAHGEAAGQEEAALKLREDGFMEGYVLSRQTQLVLDKLKQGLVTANDPEVADLLDLSSEDGLYRMGLRIGTWEAEKQAAEERAEAEEEQVEDDEAGLEEAEPVETDPPAHAVKVRSKESTPSIPGKSGGDSSKGAHGKRHANGSDGANGNNYSNGYNSINNIPTIKLSNGMNGAETSTGGLQSSVHAVHSSEQKEANLIDLL